MTQENIKPSLSGSKGHILIIEDDDNIRIKCVSLISAISNLMP